MDGDDGEVEGVGGVCADDDDVERCRGSLGCKGMADNVRVTRDMRRHVQYLEGASKVHTVTCVRVWQKGGVWALLSKGLPLLLRI